MAHLFQRAIGRLRSGNTFLTTCHQQLSALSVSTKWMSSATPSTGDLEGRFTQSVANSKKLKDDPGNDAKLKLYSLFKQASVGPNTTPKPGAFDIVGKYKWQAWANLGDKTKDEAMKEYIDYVEQLEKEVGTTK